MSDETFVFDGAPVPMQPGDSILLALTRAGIHPNRGGPLCFGGDCPSCLCTVDGVSYVRSCQTAAVAGATVDGHPPSGEPPLPAWDTPSEAVVNEYRSTDVVIIGGGEAGQAELEAARRDGRAVELFDAGSGSEVIGVYPGPLVVVRTPTGMVRVECHEIVIATGAADVQPVVPGSDLAGIYTPGAAATLAAADVDVGTPVTIDGSRLNRFEGVGRVEAAVVTDDDGSERRIECSTVVVDLGRYPRDGLARMASDDPSAVVRVVGDATIEPELPTCPSSGVVCPCSNVTAEQLDDLYERGFTHMELLKRGALAGTGTCQGGVCTPYLRSFLAERDGTPPQPAFTARPVARQLTLDEMAAGSHLPTAPRTALDAVHRSLGARMDRVGGWWRPWTYGDTDAEYAAVRERVSLGDVSTLGKMRMTGPDAEAALQRLFPTDVSTIRAGRARYALLLDERGYVADDGMIAREPDDTFSLTFTSGGASFAEMWIRDWTASWGHDIRLINDTFSTGAINVTGPLATELLARAGVDEPPPYLGHGPAVVAGVPCKLFRLSFTGELSYELHHPVGRSVELWHALMQLGDDLGILPHGLEALVRLRLEKGHILVGQDTDYDSTPRRIQHEWAVNMNKGDFIGRQAVERTDRVPLDRKLVGFVSDEPLPFEGAVAWSGDAYAGQITSAAWSPALGQGVAMGWLEASDGLFPDTVTVEGIEARVAPLPFYDPEGVRPRA